MKVSRPRMTPSVRRGAASGPVSSEVLEGRRMFAAFAPPAFDAAGQHFDYAIVIASRIPPMLAWQSQLAAFRTQQPVSDSGTTAGTTNSTSTTTTTAASKASQSVDTAAVAAVTSDNSSAVTVPVRFVTSPSVTLQARTTDMTGDSDAAVIDQVMTTSNTAATAKAAQAAASTQAAATFGSYTVKLGDISTGTTKTIESGLIDLLAVNASRNTRLAAWEVNAAANARRVTAAEASADLAAGDLPTINSDDVVMQAALPIVPGDASMRPLWQRVALFTAAGVIFAANWIIRRKQRKLALAARL